MALTPDMIYKGHVCYRWVMRRPTRLRCLEQSLVTALTSADLRREVVPGLLHFSCLSLSRCVRFTNRFTEPVLDLWLSALPGLGLMRRIPRPAPSSPGPGPCPPPLLPIGLTAADLFAAGKVSRADSRVR